MRPCIIDEYPNEAKQSIHRLIQDGSLSIEVYDWLLKTWFPKWGDTHPEWCISERTVRNYMDERFPEWQILSKTVVKKAVERLDENVDAMKNIEQAIHDLRDMINRYQGKQDLDWREIAELRRLLKEWVITNNLYVNLQMRLGIVKEESQKQEITMIDKITELKAQKEKEDKEKEEKALAKAVNEVAKEEEESDGET